MIAPPWLFTPRATWQERLRKSGSHSTEIWGVNPHYALAAALYDQHDLEAAITEYRRFLSCSRIMPTRITVLAWRWINKRTSTGPSPSTARRCG